MNNFFPNYQDIFNSNLFDSEEDEPETDDEDEILTSILNISIQNMQLITSNSSLNCLCSNLSIHVKNSFEIIYQAYEEEVMKQIKFPNKNPIQMLMKTDVLILLQYMTGMGKTEIARLLKISKMDVNLALKRGFKFFGILKNKYIAFPKTIVNLLQTSRAFNSICNLDSIAGLIGITSFPISSNDSEELSLQICIDHKDCITAIDTQLTKTETEIYDMIWRPLQRLNISIPSKYKLYGTSELYSHLDVVLQCSPDYQVLNDKADKLFDELRTKFMRLNYLKNNNNNITNNDIVMVACVLYNILLFKRK